MKRLVNSIKRFLPYGQGLLFGLLLLGTGLHAQPGQRYTVKDGRMIITLDRNIAAIELKKFVGQFDLQHLALDRCLQTGFTDSLQKAGWRMEKSDPGQLIISKPLLSFDELNDPAERILLTGRKQLFKTEFPAVSNQVKYGYNRFRGGPAFRVRDSAVQFTLKGFGKAQQVMLAGSFNDWNPGALAMQPTDSGWTAAVKLRPGKYWYKFIVDGKWITDPDNRKNENDGMGNTNSVFFYTNTKFRLPGFGKAKKVILTGSFNDWEENELVMEKTPGGWELPLYLAAGTHTYRFIADGQWLEDPQNPEKLPNEFGEYNSVITLGSPYVFRLEGFTDARQVLLAGSFNQWRDYELSMRRTATGWELPYVLGPGNYQYRFLVDGKPVADPVNPPSAKDVNAPSILVIAPNFSFRLKGFDQARNICLAGSFNDWSPDGFRMKRTGDEWILDVHLYPGKQLYKFVVDGKWILDPANELWEENEHQTGNSVLWID